MNEPDDTDMLAAEYVLGTLDADERAAVGTRLGVDADLAHAVGAWEDRLAPLAEAVHDLTPPVAVYDAILARLFGQVDDVVPSRSDLGGGEAMRRRLRFWQASTGGLALLAASLLAWVAVRETRPAAPDVQRFTAVLQRDASSPAIVLDIDLASRRLTVKPLLASAPAGHSYELWIIDPALGHPRSLGVVAAGSGVQESLDAYEPSVITTATYAVTLEAVGGSSTGQPTAAPILTGKLAGTRS